MPHRFGSGFHLAFACALAGACEGAFSPPAPRIEPPEIMEVLVPDPVVEGSIFEVRGLALEQLGDAPKLVLKVGSARVGLLDAQPRTTQVPNGRLLFELSAEAVAELGVGQHVVEVTATGEGPDSTARLVELRVADSLPVTLTGVPRGEVYRNEVAVLQGSGLIAPSEGELRARFVGTYTVDQGGERAVDLTLPVAPLEQRDRTRGVVVLTTDLGGLTPGTFEGTVRLSSALRSGAQSESTDLETRLHFNPPTVFGVEPSVASLGQVLRVRGAGFLGGEERPDEFTDLRVDGVFTPPTGAPEYFFAELVPHYVSGDIVELTLVPEVRRSTLVSQLFGHARGTFTGTATPITSRAAEELAGSAAPFSFALGPIRQVVYVGFLPGFYDSLTHFGLANAAPEVEARVRERMQDIFAEWNVDIRFEEPRDFGRGFYSRLEIGGPDPNGVGLFGYDNTPGKDIHNLRLHDTIGGANAQTQSDGYPGFGGVFVESFLYWSDHPGLPGDRPAGAPQPDPLFDEVFDPVRRLPASRAEARGSGASGRVAAVAYAIHALGSLIGETSSHELGHSFGLAQPYGPPTRYHNDFDGEGCLMDSGNNRPLGERMALEGFPPTRLCYDHPEYMTEILGR